MLTTILSGLFLLAIGQGLFLAVVLLLGARRPELRAANGLLAALMLLCVAVVGHAWLGVAGLYPQWPHGALAVLPLGFATGPLLYLYLSCILREQLPGRGRFLAHFLPFVLATLALLPFYLQPAEAKLAWMRSLDGAPWYVGAAALAKLLLFLAYLKACYRLVNEEGGHPLASGLHRLLGIWLVGGGLSMLALALEFAPGLVSFSLPVSADTVGALVLLYFLYATAYLAIRQPLGYRPAPPAPAATPAASKPRYGDRLLPDPQRAEFLARLEACMAQEQPWRDGELKLEALAERLALTPHELSQLINGACGANFQDFLNRYRVEALKLALRDPAQSGSTILDLALASGFNSKSALNRVFKAHAGLTPGEFRRLPQASLQV